MGDIPTRHRHSVPEPRGTVRSGELDRTLDRFNLEIGQKVARTITDYHKRHVIPLIIRVEWLEMSRWERARIIFSRWWDTRAYPWLKARYDKERATEAPARPVDVSETSVATAPPA